MDYRRWGELAYQSVKHDGQRYGEKEVQSWWWEVGNEPDMGYWQGTQEDYFKRYDSAATGLNRALQKVRSV